MLDINIAGAGIAGLTAAIALRRSGHNVHIYERSAMNNEVGAAIFVPPNSFRFLTAWGFDPVQCRLVKQTGFFYYDPFSMEVTAQVADKDSVKRVAGLDVHYSHRVDLHNALKQMATGPDGPGKPVTIHLKSDVVAYDPDKPSLTLKGGEEICGDVVIGCDGVHSVALEAVTGQKNMPVEPGFENCCFRFLIPAEDLRNDPETKFFVEEAGGHGYIFAHNETMRRIVVYPCRDNTVINFGAMVYEEAKAYRGREDWCSYPSTSVEELVDKYSDFHPKLLKVISKATELKKWPLLYRRPISTWQKGRMVLAGEAAHPMLPHQGQGGASGMEDGLVLGIVLQGATSENIEERLRLYADIRRNRASAMQILSNVGQDQPHLIREDLLPFMKEEDIPKNTPEILKHNYAYDVVRVTLDAMKKYDESFELAPDFFDSEVVGVPEKV